MSNGFDLTQHINLRDPGLLEDFRHILMRRAEGNLTPRGAANKIKEAIGERQALERIQRRFPGARELMVALRPNRVPVLDIILVTPDGRFVVVEAKFSSSGVPHLGRSNGSIWVSRPGGWTRLNVRGGTTQMSPAWIEKRIAELREFGFRRVAGQLNQALRGGNFNAYTVVTDSTGEVLEVIDHTDDWARSFQRRGVELRTQSPTVEPAPTESPVGTRAIDNRLGPGAVAEEAETVAARRAGSMGVRKSGEAAVRRTAVRAAARAVGRVLVAVIGRVLMALNVIGLAFLIVEIIQLITDYFAELAIASTIEKALKTHVPGEITAALDRHRDEIARYYARVWLNRGSKSETFLYLSPRMTVVGGLNARTASFDFDAHVTVKSLTDDLVSIRSYSAERKDIVPLGPVYYEIAIRWSIDQPMFTPFDIYLAFNEFFVEHVVDSWAAHYASGRKLNPATVALFQSTVEILAEISATVKFEPWFGYERGPEEFSSSKAAIGRWEALQRLSKQIEKELIPKVSTLESQRLINTATVRWDAYWSPLRSELDPRGEESLVPAMRRIATDMKYLDAKDLHYECFETLHARVRAGKTVFGWRTGNSIEAQRRIDLMEFLKPIKPHLPRSAKQEPFVLEVPSEFAGSLVLDPNDQ
jgi:hypothetical protein